ncbi:MAG: ferredoxin, 2Fe-2S type, ISC system [Candidatus Peregrinibacteria bacterium Gr01-1014_25]|nr:MAG: ferredoxin, 2Fe-2S type, ISC system [Candidatus Peregrinibacteria bacterium Gr01-1014_25]
MPKITFQYAGVTKTVDAKSGESLLKIALDNGIPMEHACGGNGFCTTCMCTVKSGGQNLAPRTDREEHMGITSDPYRLGCQTRVTGDGDVEIEVSV